MRCSEFRVRLEQLLDNRLDPEMDWKLTSHAEECEACRDELSGQQLLSEATDLFDMPQLGDSFAKEVTAAAVRRPLPARIQSSRVWWFTGIAVAASALVAFNFLNPASWQEDSNDHLSEMRTGSVKATADSPQESPEPNPAPNLAGNADAIEANAGDVSPQTILPSGPELFSLQSFDSDEIPGVRPLKTSLDVTISLLKQTIPGRGSSQAKQPATSQIVGQRWYPV